MGRYWILPAEMASRALMLAALAAFVFLARGGAKQRAVAAGLSLLAASFVAEMAQRSLFYRAIRCPACGHNPTRYKNGRNTPVKVAWKRLREMERCPQCGAAGGPDVE